MLAGICALVMVSAFLGWVAPLYLSHGSAAGKQSRPIVRDASLHFSLESCSDGHHQAFSRLDVYFASASLTLLFQQETAASLRALLADLEKEVTT
jgi:hypothetical protein